MSVARSCSPLSCLLLGCLYTPVFHVLLLATRLASPPQVDIINQYNTYSFSGEKYVVLSTTNWLGGSSIVLGIAYLAAGGLSLLMAVVYLLITFIKPRKFADTTRLMKKHAMMAHQLPAGGA